ncbi:MAG TPA: pyrroloquinoline quinone-dependent dehydrogenase, partial [Acidobacteria bacterium]|nr:pyrroloquinoline quinone-dependent dehydrogenase [Acidobacteriota bacterium]
PPDEAASPADAWHHYGRDAGGTRFSPASEITKANVDQLEIAWTYRTGDLFPGMTTFQTTPLLADGLLYFTSPYGRVIAVNARRGHEVWGYDPDIDIFKGYGDYVSRGVAYWPGPTTDAAAWEAADPPDTCTRRIFVATLEADLIGLDAATGLPCAEFGVAGTVSLLGDLVNDPETERFQEYATTSPPMVAQDLVVVGSSIGDNNRQDAPSGVVRAYSARTGELRWAWDPIPRTDADDRAGDWQGDRARRNGAANVWTTMSADVERGLLFVPTSSPSPDFYGGERLGDNRNANSLVALRLAIGEPVWDFQAVHHDVWDYDLPAQPILATIPGTEADGEVQAVAQLSKMGFTFVLDRETGEPLFPIEERALPASDVPGEATAPTQPFPTLPEPLAPSQWNSDALFGATDEDLAWCRDFFAPFRNDGLFTPPSLQGSIVYPGNGGGANWSGGAYDPTRGLLIGVASSLPTVVRLIPRAEVEALAPELRRNGWQVSPQTGTPYAMARSFPLSPSGLPCNPPPWGVLAAIDLATGDTAWKVPLGSMVDPAVAPEAAAWGSISFGGPIVTASGLVFVAGSIDANLRALVVETGAELWKGVLPAGGHATPMTYSLDGR